MEQSRSDGNDEVEKAESDSSFDVVVVDQGANDEEQEDEINERSPLEPPIPVAVLEGQNLDLEKKPFPYKLSKKAPLNGERRKFNSVGECFTVFWILSGLVLCAIIISFSVLFGMKVIQTYDSRIESLKTSRLNETNGNASYSVEATSPNGQVDQNQVPSCSIPTDYFVEPVYVNETVFKRLRQLESYDCDYIKTVGSKEDLPDGPYVLQMRVGLSLVRARVRCDMTTFNGGWTVIQRRGPFENPEDFFNRSWTDYTRGFGDEEGEYWLGLDMVTTMAEIKDQELLVQFWDAQSNVHFASYNYFSLSNDGFYKLNIGSFAGNATESLGYSFDEPFSTADRDNDRNASRSCASERGGGWWYRDCAPANLNGLNSAPSSESASRRAQHTAAMNWGEVRVTRSEVKIRPKDSIYRSDWQKIWPASKENESKLIS